MCSAFESLIDVGLLSSEAEKDARLNGFKMAFGMANEERKRLKVAPLTGEQVLLAYNHVLSMCEATRIKNKKRALDKHAKEKRAAKKHAAKKRVVAERVAAERVASERVAEERVAEERVAEERVAAERIAEERVAEERVAEERDVTKTLTADISKIDLNDPE